VRPAAVGWASVPSLIGRRQKACLKGLSCLFLEKRVILSLSISSSPCEVDFGARLRLHLGWGHIQSLLRAIILFGVATVELKHGCVFFLSKKYLRSVQELMRLLG